MQHRSSDQWAKAPRSVVFYYPAFVIFGYDLDQPSVLMLFLNLFKRLRHFLR